MPVWRENDLGHESFILESTTVIGVSRTQRIVSLSSTEAEYVAADGVAKGMLFVRGINEYWRAH